MIRKGWVALIILGLVYAASSLAQDSSLYTLKVDVASVSLDVGAFDESGQPITKLTKQDFQIYEDGRRQEIENFASSDSAYSVLLVIDRSGSITEQLPFLSEAVNRFMRNLRAEDRVALAAFDESVDMLFGWRSVREGASRVIKLGSNGRSTDFYGAMSRALRELGKVKGRKAALVFSDGQDTITKPQDQDKVFGKLLEQVRQARVPFYFVGVGGGPTVEGGIQMNQMAEASGGHAFFTAKIQDVVPLYDQVSRELGASYTLEYSSDRPERDAAYRRIEVVVPAATHISQSRPGYYAN